MHLDNNTFSEGDQGTRSNFWEDRDAGDGGRGTFIEGEEVRVVVVDIKNGRVSDWKGAVRDWSLSGVGESERDMDAGRLVNGLSSP